MERAVFTKLEGADVSVAKSEGTPETLVEGVSKELCSRGCDGAERVVTDPEYGANRSVSGGERLEHGCERSEQKCSGTIVEYSEFIHKFPYHILLRYLCHHTTI